MDDLDIFLKDTYTLSDLKARSRALHSYFSRIFFGGADSLADRDMLWINALPKDFLAKFDKDNSSRQISALENKIKELPLLTLYLPFEASEEAIRIIGSMTRQLFQSQLLLDIKYDPTLLAGVALVWKGVYKDYSLRSRIEERKKEISDSFKKFLR